LSLFLSPVFHATVPSFDQSLDGTAPVDAALRHLLQLGRLHRT
jgi:hypothetical protein